MMVTVGGEVGRVGEDFLGQATSQFARLARVSVRMEALGSRKQNLFTQMHRVKKQTHIPSI